MYKTKSSKEYGVLFPNEMFETLVAFAASTDKKLPWHIRQACIEYLSRHGIDVSDLSNPEGRGARSDLKKHKTTEVFSSEELEKLESFESKTKKKRRFDR